MLEDNETVPESNVMDVAVEAAQQVAQEAPEAQEVQEKQVPLSAHQKERRKRQEADARAKYAEEQLQKYTQPQQAEDDYVSVTRREFNERTAASNQQVVRTVLETSWRKQNPDLYEVVNEKLPELLQKKPNLAYAIASSENRYEEAWELIKSFQTPAGKQTLAKVPQKKDAPLSPSSVPKSQGINTTMDVMNMSDDDFNKWRRSKKTSR